MELTAITADFLTGFEYRIHMLSILSLAPHPTYAARRHVTNNQTNDGTDGQRTDDDGTDVDGRTENGRRRDGRWDRQTEDDDDGTDDETDGRTEDGR